MRSFLAATAALILITLPARAQTPYNDFSGSQPPTSWWSPADLRITDLPTGSGRGIALGGATSTAVLLNQSNPGELRFVASTAAGASLRLEVLRSCDEGETWAAMLDTTIIATSTAADYPIRVLAQDLGTCWFRWRLPSGGSAIYLSAPQIIPLDDEQVSSLRYAREAERIARAIQAEAPVAQARSELREAEAVAYDVALSLARIATDARTIAALDQFTAAVKSRGDLANPLRSCRET